MGIYNNPNCSEVLGVFGDPINVPLTPQVQLHYTYNINSRLVDTTVNGSGSVSTSNSLLSLSTGTTTASDVCILSKRVSKYYSGQGLMCRFTAIFPTCSGTSYAEIGMANSSSGLFFGIDVNGMYINRVSNTIDNKVYINDWNQRNVSYFNYDYTKLNIYQIELAWLGAATCKYYIMSPYGDWVNVHNIEYANKYLLPSLDNPHMKIYMCASNGNTTDDIVISSASQAIFLQGLLNRNVSSLRTGISRVLTNGAAGDNLHLITIRNRSTFHSKDNLMKIFLLNLSVAYTQTGTKILTIKILKNCTLSGMTFNNYDTNNSLIETSTVGTITNGLIVYSINLAKDTSISQKFSDIEDDIYISPTESFSVIYSVGSGNTADINVDLEFLEDI